MLPPPPPTCPFHPIPCQPPQLCPCNTPNLALPTALNCPTSAPYALSNWKMMRLRIRISLSFRLHLSLLRPMDYLHCLVLIFSHHVYHRTILTRLWLPYWTYALSRYLAAMLCSHTFLSRMMFARSHDPHCPVSLTPLHTISCAHESVRLLYLQTLLLLTIHMTEHLSAHYCAAVPTPFAYASPYFTMTCYLNRFT